ncbi:MAG TPA: hypothetical protein ENH01_03030 [Nitrospirae bacterium]|nr:hypothetical protein [Nitrospirota bacterium]
MKRIIITLVIMLSVILSYSIYSGIKSKSGLRNLNKEIEKTAEKAQTMPTEKLPAAIEEKAAPAPVRQKIEKPVETPEAILITKTSAPVEKKPGVPQHREKEGIPEISLKEKPFEGIKKKTEIKPPERKAEKPAEKIEISRVERPPVPVEEKAGEMLAEKITAGLLIQPLSVIPGEPDKGIGEKRGAIPPGMEEAKSGGWPETVVKAADTADIKVKQTGNRVAVFPFENFSDDSKAIDRVMPVLIRRLKERGVEVVDEKGLSDYLCKERVRATGYVSGELARKIKERFNVKAILVGSVISFSTGENPEFGILARLIDSSGSRILWADYASATGEDFTTILGLGKLKTPLSLVPGVMKTLFASFNPETLHRETEPSYRIAVMPFKNNSDFRNAGKIAMYMFIVELLKDRKFEPIEYGNTRELIVRLGIRSRGYLDYKNMNVLSENLGADGILVGAVDDFTKGAAASSPPEAAVSARLLDGGNNKILWYNSRQLNGEENVIAFDWGRVISVHTVAYRIISNLVKNMGSAKWQ